MYIPLHVHTEYSFLDGLNKIKALIARAKERGLTHLAITDHNITGIVDFYFACKKAGIIPIIGVEMYINNNPTEMNKDNRRTNHLVMLAKNLQGFKDLIKIYSEAATKYFYYRPRISLDLIKEFNTGNIIVSTACINGRVPSLLLKGQETEAMKELYKYKEVFGEDNVYIELMPLEMEQQKTVNQLLVKLAQKTNTDMIITTDAHYLEQEDAEIQGILMRVAHEDRGGSSKGLEMDTKRCWLMVDDEIRKFMKQDHPSISSEIVEKALENTTKIANQCESYDIAPKTLQVPDFKLPEGKTADQMLNELCYTNLPKFYGNREDARKRLDYELSVINKLGYSSYFLIVHDLISYARSIGATVGPGRGSAAGCVVSYLLGIVRLDPIKWGLHFERFLNPERAKPPDIDIDFGSRYRDKVIEYIQHKYGEDNVAHIITYSRLGVKSALKDVGKAMAVASHTELNNITKNIPNNYTLEIALDKMPEVREAKKKYKKLFDVVEKVENLPRNPGKHPAGVIITSQPITNYAAIAKDTKAEEGEKKVPILQLDMEAVTKMNLLKVDCLGVTGIDLIEDTCKEIEKNWKIKITQDDLDNLDLNDPIVYKFLKTGKTSKIFQLSSYGMRKLIKEVKPDCFEDLAAINALYRPAALNSGTKDNFVWNKNHPEDIKYLHPDIIPFLKESYGVIAFQEQVMGIFSHFSGISFGESDLFRRHLDSPKDAAGIKERKMWREKFVTGSLKMGLRQDLAIKIFEWLAEYAGYGFNKAHSACYSMNAFQMAYLKALFFLEFMICTLRVEKDDDKKHEYVKECYEEGYPILSVDVNKSGITFECENNNSIRAGFSNVKGIGESPSKAIMENALMVPGSSGYKNMVDFFFYNKSSMNLIRRILEPLVFSGAFDSLVGGNRKAAKFYVGAFLELEKDLKKIHDIDSYRSLFDIYLKQERTTLEELLKAKDYNYEQKSNMENDYLCFGYRNIKAKKRNKPQVSFDKNKKIGDNIKSDGDGNTLQTPQIRRESGNMREGKNIVEVLDVKAEMDDNNIYQISVKDIKNKNEYKLRVTKSKVIKFKEHLKKGNKILVINQLNEEGKRKVTIEVYEEDAKEEVVSAEKTDNSKVEKQEIEEKSEVKEHPKEDVVAGVDEKTMAMGQVLLHITKVPWGVKLALFDALSKGESVKKFSKSFLLDCYITKHFDHFVENAGKITGKCTMDELYDMEKQLLKDERYSEMCRPKPIVGKTKEELKKMKVVLIKLLNKYLKDMEEADSDSEEGKQMIKEFIRRENELSRIERTLML